MGPSPFANEPVGGDTLEFNNEQAGADISNLRQYTNLMHRKPEKQEATPDGSGPAG